MQRGGIIIAIAVALLVACVLVSCLLVLGTFNYTANYGFSSPHAFRQSILAYVPHFLLLGTAKTRSSGHFDLNKHSNQSHNAKSKGSKISVFTGRGANKNHAIFKILAVKGPLPISDLQKLLNKQRGLEVTYYASLNKRIHSLEKGGYIAQAHPASPNRTGFKAALYEVRAKFYLASFLNGNSRDEILNKLTDTNATIILADLIDATMPSKKITH